jgi:RNA polymerase sigma-70 factor (ECF subfamily)
MTLWSVVLAAGSTHTEIARPALQRLCETYWFPLYAFARRQGFHAEDAEDIVQGFFASLLEHNGLARVDRAKGRFRSFLLASLRHYISNFRDHRTAQKRGGGQELVSLDAAAAEERYHLEPADDGLTPERAFDRQWALALLDRALGRLRDEHAAADKTAHFAALQETLTGDRVAGGYAVLGAKLHMSEGAVKVAVHRLRQRYRDILREEVAATTSSPGEDEDELKTLLDALGG